VDQKLALLKTLVGDVRETDDQLLALLTLAGDKILAKRYPFGVPEGAEVPSQYSSLQVELALYLCNKRGADYQKSHSEDGVSRTWESESDLLRAVVPMCSTPTSIKDEEDAELET